MWEGFYHGSLLFLTSAPGIAGRRGQSDMAICSDPCFETKADHVSVTSFLVVVTPASEEFSRFEQFFKVYTLDHFILCALDSRFPLQ